MKSKLLPSIVLSSICLVVILLLAVVNSLTAPVIAEAQERKVQESLTKILPDGVNFIEIRTDGLPEDITGVYTEDGGGYVFRIEKKGYKSGLVIMCGINSSGTVVNADYISSNETLSKEVGLGSKYAGMDQSSFVPEIISGATKTTKAYAEAIKSALDAFEILTNKEDAQ